MKIKPNPRIDSIRISIRRKSIESPSLLVELVTVFFAATFKLKRILMVTVVTFLAELFVGEVGGSKLAIFLVGPKAGDPSFC